MRQIALRDFRLQGSRALGKLGAWEAVLLAGRKGPAFFLIPVDPEAREAQEEELRTALALVAMRESWRKAEEAGISEMTQAEIDNEIAAARKERVEGATPGEP